MKNLLKIGYIILFVMMFISFNIGFAFAASSAKIEMKTTVTSIKPEDILQVEVRLVNVNIGAGATGVRGVLNYDKNVLELLAEDQQNNVINGWTKSYNENNGVILVDRANNAKEDQTIAVLKFKVKKDAEIDKNTTILLKNIEVNDENETISTDNAQLELKVVKVDDNTNKEGDNKDSQKPDSEKENENNKPSEGSNEPNNDNTGDGNNDGSNDNNNNNKQEEVDQNKDNNNNKNDENKDNTKQDTEKQEDNSKDTNTKQDTGKQEDNTKDTNTKQDTKQDTTNGTGSSKNIPKLGIADSIVPIVIISTVVIIGIISFIKYRKYKEI